MPHAQARMIRASTAGNVFEDRTLDMHLTIDDMAYVPDGGTLALHAIDDAGGEHSIVITQHANPLAARSGKWLPGRLYLDDDLIPMRSEREAGLLRMLREADVVMQASAFAPDAGNSGMRDSNGETRALIAKALEFIESPAYHSFAIRVEQALDPIRYTVWIADDPGTRARIVVRIANADGIGIAAARERIEGPLATDGTAVEVLTIFARYGMRKSDFHTEPEFPWLLE